jgi:hypothetical protein
MYDLQQLADNAFAYLGPMGTGAAARDLDSASLKGPGFLPVDIVREVLRVEPGELVDRLRGAGLTACEVLARDRSCVAVLFAHGRKGMDAAELALTEHVEREFGILVTPEYIPDDPGNAPS